MKNTKPKRTSDYVDLYDSKTPNGRSFQKPIHDADLSSFVFGKVPPNASPLEEAVLGAILVDSEAYHIVADILKAEDFYSEAHQNIFNAMQNLRKESKPIDLLTIEQEMRRTKTIESIGGVYYLVEMMNRVASSANIEYHARIIKEKAFRRELIATATYAIREAYEETKDVFDLNDEISNRTRINNPKRILRVMSMNDAIIEGAKMPKRKELVGNLIRENELTILYGDEGTGKSILAFQIAIAMSKGKNLFGMEEFKNECGELKTLVFDFELETAELFERYSLDSQCYDFGKNLFRSDLNPDCLDLENGSDKLMKAVQQAIEAHQPAFVVVDNITWLVDEAQDANIATTFMKKILTMQRKTGFSCIIVAHTPKRNTSEPIESRHLAGSKNLSNFAKNLIAVSHSKLDPNVRYIKQIKCRNAMKLYGYDNVIQCAIEKEAGSALLEWKFRKTSPEILHLAVAEEEMTETEICQKAIELREEKKTWQDIVDELNLKMDRTTLMRKVAKFETKMKEFNEIL